MTDLFGITVGLAEEQLVNGDFTKSQQIQQKQHLLKHVQLAAQR
jgi:hypothetical protein